MSLNLLKLVRPASMRLSTMAMRPTFIRAYSVKRYTRDHEWATLENNVVTIGITEHAAKSLGEIVHVELPEVDGEAEKGVNLCSIESVKAVGEVNSPISGKVVEVNEGTLEEPEKVSSDPEGEGWLCKVEVENSSDYDELMDKQEYEKYLETEEH